MAESSRRRPRGRLVAIVSAAAVLAAAGVTWGVTTASAATAGVVTGYGGTCVDVAGASSANGTLVQLYTCNGTTAQSWTVGSDGTLKALGKCLDVAAAGTGNGAKVQIYACNGTAAQKWTSSNGELVNTGSGKCLDATGPSSAAGTKLQIWTCTGGANQLWSLPSGSTGPTAVPPTTPPTTVPPTTPPTTPTATPTGSPPASPSAGGFVHPGVLDDRAQLDFVKAKVAAGAEPWKSAYSQMLANSFASLSRTPKPRATVECGSYSNPDNGCTDERQDALAAYTDALAWYLSGNAAYAHESIKLMDAWSATITTHTNSNAPLQTGWAGSVWPRAAEIIRYTYSSWPGEARFATMLRTVYLPEVRNGSNSNGNWELSMMEAAVGISVFLDDRTTYNASITRYLNRVQAYIYEPSDGALPHTVPGSGLTTSSQIVGYWQGQSTFVAGLTQETCRDFVHTGYGISAISHVAETSRIQGNDLYPTVGQRLRDALGFQSQYQLGAAVPAWLCGGKLTLGLGPVTEVGYNAEHNRLGNSMTNTQTLTAMQRPAGTDYLFVAWETLTHGDNPA